MSNKQVLVYGLLESTNDLRSIFVRHILFKKLLKFRKFLEIFHCCLTRLRNKKKSFFQSCLLIRTTSRKENTGQRNFQKQFKFHTFSEIFYCSMTNQYTRTILRNKNVGQSLFIKTFKISKFRWNILCGMTRLRNTEYVCFYTMLIHKRTISSKKNLKQSQLKKQTKFLTFNKVILPWQSQTWHG